MTKEKQTYKNRITIIMMNAPGVNAGGFYMGVYAHVCGNIRRKKGKGKAPSKPSLADKNSLGTPQKQDKHN